MNHYFITGTSRGIGKAIAEQLLLILAATNLVLTTFLLLSKKTASFSEAALKQKKE